MTQTTWKTPTDPSHRPPRHRAAGTRVRGSLRVLVCAAATALFSSPAAADLILSAGAGGISPWKGSGGYSVLGSAGFNVISEFTRLDLEFEYRGTDVTVLFQKNDPINLPVDTYDIRGVFRLVFNPGGFTPYLGFGAGLKIIVVDDRNLKKSFGLPDSIVSTSSYGLAGGLMGLVGLELPLFDGGFAIFAEARADYAWEFTDGVSAVLDNDQAGAFAGVGGLRFSF